ncbi:MAG: enoyl-[acyl-carrier-protein] reductase FabK [Clostridiales Family XIII bacterium]|jgi:enoyl-[acyl-carrier protein] reductase II|nr:enoyl-[acyl-carrier-protein] reductase FabK [Clostridiales Family XIII bacterium]
MNEITELLGIRLPILQGGMTWVSDWHLVSAVSEAGGLGLIMTGSAPPDYVREQIRAVRAATDKPFGVNVVMLNENVDDLMQLMIDEKVPVITAGAGNPGKYVPALKEAGVKVVPVVASVALAKRLERAGADALVAEGLESGGHIGDITTMALVPQVVDAVSVPVIAAGGIADGRGMAAAFLLGAKGVQIGTRLLAARETNIAQAYKDRVVAAGDSDTIVTGRSTGHPCRVLKTKYMKEILRREKEGIEPEEFELLMTGTLRKAAVDGDLEGGSFMAGQIAGLVKKEETVAEILDDLMDGMRAAFAAQEGCFK